MQSFTLTLLSYDRFVAICFPLRYNEIVTNKSILVITTMLWIVAGMATLLSCDVYQHTVILQIHCDKAVISVITDPCIYLACNDNTPSSVINWTHPIMTLWLPVLFITCTYMCIASSVIKNSRILRAPQSHENLHLSFDLGECVLSSYMFHLCTVLFRHSPLMPGLLTCL